MEKNSLLIQIREISNQEIPATLDKLEELEVTININSQYTNVNRVMSWRAINQKSWNINYNPTQVTGAEKFLRNSEIKVSNSNLMVTNTSQTKQNQRKKGKISKYEEETLTVKKFPRKIETSQ